ncbi:RHS repeat-associated core domain-containing protein [Phototrophicus methaneseepsis]|uniref:RHS repeat-associated core domain-containing protein n=1 Tax=Phototrophicus methaneseepsis TaxID=2710758 RepID=A0A7S8E8S4_9CHLR|nr:RHS repeat-associated core domain-containing protein [Phototrophicus methaneseepsis]
MDASADVLASQSYAPYGLPFDISGSFELSFGFTGEQTDANDLLYLRARYYAPEIGVFTALDPFEGIQNRPMSLNGYSWVEGNPINNVDPNGNFILAGAGAAAGRGCNRRCSCCCCNFSCVRQCRHQLSPIHR